MNRLHNLTEEIVLRQSDKLIPLYDCCDCQNCRLDIASYALNRLPAKYVVSTQGELMARLDSLDPQFVADVTSVLSQSIIKVHKNPRHS